MTHTEEQIKELALKMMRDIGVDYFLQDQIELEYKEKLELFWGEDEPKGWLISIGIISHRYPTQPDSILIFFDEEKEEVINYVESEGRTVPYTLKKDEEGKYYRYPLYDYISDVKN